MAGGTAEKLETLIGRLTMIWNDAQSMVYLMFSDLLAADHDRSKAIFFSLRSDGAQRVVTTALAKSVLRDEKLTDDVVGGLERFSRMAGRRNDFIHTIWHADDATKIPTPWLNLAGRLVGKDPMEEAQRLINDVSGLLGELVSLRTRVKESVSVPRNSLVYVTNPWLPGLLSPPPPQPAEQRATADQALPPDDPVTPPPPRPASEE
jgi:hypothetical protein